MQGAALIGIGLAVLVLVLFLRSAGPTVHLAREEGIQFVAAGHHATERYGVQALGEHLSSTLGLEHRYFEIDNPV